MGIKRIKILRIFLYIFIAIGFGLIFWPVYTNFIASRGVSEELSEWEELKDEISAGKSIETDEGDQAENTLKLVEETVVDTGEDAEDVPAMDFSQDGVGYCN